MAPCLLTEAVHHGVEVAVGGVEEVIDVFEHLDVAVEVHHLAEVQELQFIWIKEKGKS